MVPWSRGGSGSAVYPRESGPRERSWLGCAPVKHLSSIRYPVVGGDADGRDDVVDPDLHDDGRALVDAQVPAEPGLVPAAVYGPTTRPATFARRSSTRPGASAVMPDSR